MRPYTAIIIGSGNVAAFLCRSFQQTGIKVERVIARNESAGKALAAETGSLWQREFSPSEEKETVIISTVRDAAAQEVWSRCQFKDNLVLHTAGSLPLSALAPYAANCGVLYPLQSISAQSLIDSRRVPFLIEANSAENLQKVRTLARRLSPMVRECSSGSREKIHLAAVFANNFSNLCFRMAWELAEKEGIAPELLLPLIEESCAKLRTLSPAEAQTGPAVRNDKNVMQKHLELLQDMPETAAFYRLASQEILRRRKK